MRIVQINENRTDKPVVVKKIKISCSSHLSGVSATPIGLFFSTLPPGQVGLKFELPKTQVGQ